MFSSITSKILAGALVLALLAGAGLAVFGFVEKSKVSSGQATAAKLATAHAVANSANASRNATATVSAYAAQASGQATAAQASTDALARLAVANAASATVANTVVPEADWEAIYGDTNATK